MKSADTRERTAAVGDGNGDDDFVGARGVGHARLDRIEMTSDERRVFVSERHVDRRTDAAHFLRRWNERRPFLDCLPERRAKLRMENRRSVLELARFTDDRRLPVAFGLPR